MYDFLEVMVKPFIACAILTGIHVYLGLHVIKRGVIFVDLALAQVAALGATLGFVLGFGLHSLGSHLVSLGLTVLVAAILAFAKLERFPVPTETFIGIIYAVSAAMSIIVLSKAPEGGEELKNLMVGHLLFVEWPEIVKILLIYSTIGALHWIYRKEFLWVSESLASKLTGDKASSLYNFAFFVSFAIVVTSSVEVGGVLLVFAYLIIPAVTAALMIESVRGRLLLGWSLGVLGSIVGVICSYWLDWPTGASVVSVMGLMPVSVVLIKSLSLR